MRDISLSGIFLALSHLSAAYVDKKDNYKIPGDRSVMTSWVRLSVRQTPDLLSTEGEAQVVRRSGPSELRLRQERGSLFFPTRVVTEKLRLSTPPNHVR